LQWQGTKNLLADTTEVEGVAHDCTANREFPCDARNSGRVRACARRDVGDEMDAGRRAADRREPRRPRYGRKLAGARVCALAPCPPLPRAACGTAARSKILLQRKSTATRIADQLDWSWTKSSAVAVGDLDDPTTGTDYAVRVYKSDSGSEALTYEFSVPASSLWRQRLRGYLYADRSAGERGLRRIALKSGDAGESEVAVCATGAILSGEWPHRRRPGDGSAREPRVGDLLGEPLHRERRPEERLPHLPRPHTQLTSAARHRAGCVRGAVATSSLATREGRA
jgi:hypothetical protein